MKQGKSLSPEKAKKILSDGEVRDTPLTPKQRRFMGAVSSGAATRTNLGGKKPEKPRAKDTPAPSKQLAIGERPVLPKTTAKMAKMRRGL